MAIDASYFDADYDGKNQLFQTIDFAGEQFTLGTDIDSELKLKFASAKVGFGLFEIGPLVLGALVGVDYFDVGTPDAHKRHELYEMGHGPLPRGQFLRDVLPWLDEYLGPVN